MLLADKLLYSKGSFRT